MKKISALYSIVLCIFVSACSGDENGVNSKQQGEEHVWSEQTRTIDKARQVEQQMDDAFQRQRKLMEEQGG